MNVAPRGLSFTDAQRGRREERSEEGRASGAGGTAASLGLRYPGSAAEAGEKRRAAVKGRKAAKRSDVYPLRRMLFATLKRARQGSGFNQKQCP